MKRPRVGKSRSLRARLTLIVAVAVLLAVGGAAWIVDWQSDADMQRRFDTLLLTRAQAFAALVQVEKDRVEIDADSAPVTVFPGNADASWYLLSCNGVTVTRTERAPLVSEEARSRRFSDGQTSTGTRLRIVALRFDARREEIRPGLPAPAMTCSLLYGMDRQPLDDILFTLDFILLGSLFGACALVILATPWLVRRGLQPIADLDRAMANIGPDMPGGRLPHSTATELAPLVARFNEVLARMDVGLERERRFAAGLAHEFRTRLAELRMLIDVEQRYPSGRAPASLLEDVRAIGSELETTVTALLLLTRIESGLERAGREAVDVASLLARACARQKERANLREVCIEIDAQRAPDMVVETDAALLEVALDNLLGNAVDYAPTGTLVGVRLMGSDMTVSNSAPGLNASDLVSFGRRFWRKSEMGSDHVGLGLALAGAAAQALGMALTFALDDGVLHATLRLHGASAAHAPHRIDDGGSAAAG